MTRRRSGTTLAPRRQKITIETTGAFAVNLHQDGSSFEVELKTQITADGEVFDLAFVFDPAAAHAFAERIEKIARAAATASGLHGTLPAAWLLEKPRALAPPPDDDAA